MVLSVSGCVDIYGARGVLGGKEPPAPIVYRERLKAQLTRTFDTNVSDPGSWNYAASDSAVVKKGTEWLTILVQVTILEYGIIDNISKLLCITLPNIDRYVHVQVKGADGSLQWDKIYKNSVAPPESITLQSPLDGPWSLHVDAVGFGAPKYGADSFNVMMTVSEPS